MLYCSSVADSSAAHGAREMLRARRAAADDDSIKPKLEFSHAELRFLSVRLTRSFFLVAAYATSGVNVGANSVA